MSESYTTTNAAPLSLEEVQRAVSEMTALVNAKPPYLIVTTAQWDTIKSRVQTVIPGGVVRNLYLDFAGIPVDVIDDPKLWRSRIHQLVQKGHEVLVVSPATLTDPNHPLPPGSDADLIASLRIELARATNYVADRECMPRVIYFRNGRKVWIVNNGVDEPYLEVGMSRRARLRAMEKAEDAKRG